MKPKILHMNDCQKDNLHGKIIYLYAPEMPYITAYFYKNSYDFPESKIKSNCLCEKNIRESEKIKPKDLQKIAEIYVSDNQYLEHISVEPPYRGMGIGTHLIHLAISHLKLHHIVCLQEQKAAQYCLTIEGERLIASCLNKGIVKPRMCILQDSTDEGPGLVSPLIVKTLDHIKNKTSPETSLKRAHTWPGSSKGMGSFNLYPANPSSDPTFQKRLTQQEAVNQLFFPNLKKRKTI